MLLLVLLLLSIISFVFLVFGVGYASYRFAKKRDNASPVLVGIAVAMILPGLFGTVALFIHPIMAVMYAIGTGFAAFIIFISIIIVSMIRIKIFSTQDYAPLLLGAGGGIGAWIFNYMITYWLLGKEGIEFAESLIDDRFWDGNPLPPLDPETYQLVGWVYYNMHFIDTQITTQTASLTTNVIGGDGFTPLFFIIPPLILFYHRVLHSTHLYSTVSRE